MWDPNHNIAGTKEKNRMEHAHIENGRRSTGKESTWGDPWREEKPRSTDEKMERRTGITGHWPKWRGGGGEEEVICRVEDEVCVVFMELPVPMHLPTHRYIGVVGNYEVTDQYKIPNDFQIPSSSEKWFWLLTVPLLCIIIRKQVHDRIILLRFILLSFCWWVISLQIN